MIAKLSPSVCARAMAAGLIASACSNNPNALYRSPNVASSDAGTAVRLGHGSAGRAHAVRSGVAYLLFRSEVRRLRRTRVRQSRRSCAEDADCSEDATCRAECGDNNQCQYWSCRDKYPLDDRPTFRLEDCLIAACPEACDVGQSFDCVGKYGAWTPQVGEPVVLTIAPKIAATNESVPGLRARVCRGTDPECDQVGDDAWTDAKGSVTVEFPPAQRMFGALIPFTGYVELSDPNQKSPRLVTSLAFALPTAPARSPSIPWNPGLASPAAHAALVKAAHLRPTHLPASSRA